MSDEQNWYYAKGNEKFGPITSAELKQLAFSGNLQPKDHIWKTEWPEWKKAESLKGLFPPNINAPSPPRSEKAVQKIQAATEAAEQVSEKLWFLDLKFVAFATPRLIGFVFAASLLVLAVMFVVTSFYGILNYPLLQAIIGVAITLVLYVLAAVMIRVLLEICLLGFRIAEHLKYLRHLEHLDKSISDK